MELTKKWGRMRIMKISPKIKQIAAEILFFEKNLFQEKLNSFIFPERINEFELIYLSRFFSARLKGEGRLAQINIKTQAEKKCDFGIYPNANI